MAKYIPTQAEHIDPYAETPWHRSELDPDICNRYQVFIPENKPGTLAKLEWAENHAEFYEEYKYNEDYAFIYTDGSLSQFRGTRITGYGVVAYRGNEEIAIANGALGEGIEAYDAEMKALEKAAKIALRIATDKEVPLPTNIIIASDNTGAMQRIFKGSPGLAQSCSLKFRKRILETLDSNKNLKIAITWSPGHLDIEGNERADSLAKSGAHNRPNYPSYRSISYLGSAQKCGIEEEWKQRWTNPMLKVPHS